MGNESIDKQINEDGMREAFLTSLNQVLMPLPLTIILLGIQLDLIQGKLKWYLSCHCLVGSRPVFKAGDYMCVHTLACALMKQGVHIVKVFGFHALTINNVHKSYTSVWNFATRHVIGQVPDKILVDGSGRSSAIHHRLGGENLDGHLIWSHALSRIQ